MYAWSEIHTHLKDGDSTKLVTIQRGKEVNESDFDEADWNHFIDEGIIREEKYPTDMAAWESPKTYQIRKAKEQFELASAQTLVRGSKRDKAEAAEEDDEAANAKKQSWQR